MNGTPTDSAWHRTATYGIISASLLGTILRFFRLGFHSLWFDELLTLSSIFSEKGIWHSAVAANSTTPLYFYINSWIVSVFGVSEFSLRLPSCLAGSLTIPLFAGVIWRLTKNRFCSLAGAFLFALNPLHLWFSQEARPYSLMMLFGIAGFFLFLCYRENHRSSFLVSSGILFLCSFFTHKIGMLFLLSVMIYAPWGIERERIKHCVSYLAALFLVGIVPMLLYMNSFPKAYAIDRPVSFLEIPYTLLTYVAGYSFGPSPLLIQELGPLGAITSTKLQSLFSAVVLCLSLLQCSIFLREWKRLLPLFLLGILTWILVYAQVIMSAYAFNVRYTLPSHFVLLAILACSLSRPSRIRALTIMLLLLLNLISLFQYLYVPLYGKAQARDVAAWIADHYPPSTLIQVQPLYGKKTLQHYLPPAYAVGKSPENVTNSILVFTRFHHISKPATFLSEYTDGIGHKPALKIFAGYKIYHPALGPPLPE